MMILNATITTAGTVTGPTYQVREPAGHGPMMTMTAQQLFTYGSGGTSVDVVWRWPVGHDAPLSWPSWPGLTRRWVAPPAGRGAYAIRA